MKTIHELTWSRIEPPATAGSDCLVSAEYLCEFLWREDMKRKDVDAFDDILAKILILCLQNNYFFVKVADKFCGLFAVVTEKNQKSLFKKTKN